ncbi:DUF4491 family protein [Clostridium phoceensis]|uniref:DUF4491 family protein n=1 Tax=Clostridium phoceensis TaxID=1650661 RepID=UPI00265FACEE|nr:DUF4491 family protein [Clostridium phoceensis]
MIAGLLYLFTALFGQGSFSILPRPLGVTCIWRIWELKEQTRRVERGWFPKKQSENRNCGSFYPCLNLSS